MKNFFKNNSLVLALFLLFLISFFGLYFSGINQFNEDQNVHGEQQISILTYATTPHFLEAVFENWESEFLQMWALVILTIFLKQKGASDSKKMRGKEEVDTGSRYSVIHSLTVGKNRGKAIKSLIYSNSLGIALLCLFVFSFILHLYFGAALHNQEANAHSAPQLSVISYLFSSEFWFESFQNWQSEFLSVACLIILSIYLRQRGSPESKPISAPNNKTGE